MKFLKDLFFGAAQAPGGMDEGTNNNGANPSSNDHGLMDAAAAGTAGTDVFMDAVAGTDDFINNDKSKKKKSVRISEFRLEQPYDKRAPAADARQDHPIVNSVKGKRPAYQYTREELQIIKAVREKNADQEAFMLDSGHKVRNLQNIVLSTYSTHDFLPNLYGMRYSVVPRGFHPKRNPGTVFFAGAEDDGEIKNAMAHFLMSHEQKTLEALESFYKKEIQGNWTEFKQRNKQSLKNIVALAAEASGMVEEEDAEPETYENAMARILEQGFEQMATTTENMRADYQANVHMFFRQMDAQREQMDAQRRDSKVRIISCCFCCLLHLWHILTLLLTSLSRNGVNR